MAGAVSTPAGPTGGQRPEPPSLERLRAAFPQLEVIELIGQGGMGAVYKARQKQLDRIVALKVLPPGIGGDPAFAERFTREARALAKLLHPNIVTLFEFGRADGIYYLLMEYVDGVSLRQLLATGRVAPREALAIVPQICEALQFAHDHGIVHRDIKPENILMDRGGRVKVADFGLAKIIGGDEAALPTAATAPGGGPALTASLTGESIMGTPQYMAPEQAAHPGDVDHRADIYALGVVFYQMLTGQLPGARLEAPSRKVRIDVRLDEVVLRALEQKPERRYQQVSEIKTQVETIALTPGQAGVGSSPRRALLNQWVILLIVMVALAALFMVVVVGFLFMRTSRSQQRSGQAIAVAPPQTDAVDRLRARREAEAAERDAGEFRSYPVDRTWPDLGDRLDFSTPETAAASAIWHIEGGVDDPATVIGKAFLDVPRLPAGSVTITQTPQQKQEVHESRVAEVVMYRDALAGVISHQRTNGVDRFVTMIAGKRKDEWKLMVWDLDEHAKTSRAEAERQFRGDAPRLLADFQKLPDQPPIVLAAAGSEMATNLGDMMGTLINTMSRSVEAASTQLSGQIPRLASQVQNLAQNLSAPPNLNVTAGNPGVTYQVSSLGNPTLVSLNPTNGAGSPSSTNTSALIVFQNQVQIPSTPSNLNVTAGNPGATYQVAATGSAPLSYQWYLNPTNGAGSPSSTNTINPVGVQTIGGASPTFAVVATGNQPFSYQWQFNGTNVAGVQVNTNRTGLQLRWVAREADTNAPADELSDPQDHTGKETIRVLKEVVLDENDVAKAEAGTSRADFKEVSVVLTQEGARKFSSATTANVGRRLAILWHGRVLSAPVVRTPITGGQVSVTGKFTDAEANQLLDALNHRQSGDPRAR